MKEKIEEKIWKMVELLGEFFWMLYFEAGEETPWGYILKECDFDYLEQELEDRDELIEIGTMISEDKALLINREGWVVIVVKDKWESIFTGWANREKLSQEEVITALKKMFNLIDTAFEYVYGV